MATLIKVNEFPTSVDTKSWMVVADANGIAYKISIEDVKAELGIGALSQFGGAIVPTSPAPPAGDYFWIGTQEGTYTNYNGTVVPVNSFAVIGRVGGVWSSSITEFPQPENKIDDWTAGTYLLGNQTINNGQIWEVIVASTTQEPGIGTDWTGKIDKASKDDVFSIESKLNNFQFSPESGGNLLNPLLAERESLLDFNTGGYVTSGTRLNYTVTSLIPTLPGHIFEILNSFNGDFGCRNYCLYDENDNFIIGYAAGNDRTKSITIPDIVNARGVKFSVVGENYPLEPNKYYPEEIGVFAGSGNIFSYYFNSLDISIPRSKVTSEKGDKSIATIEDVNNLLSINPDSEKINYSISESGVVTVSQDGVGSISGSIGNERGFDGNNIFNFINYNIFGASGTNGDDVAPIHAMNTTIGANHGYVTQVATINAHGLTNTDIGKSFLKSGVTYILLRIVNTNQVAFISTNTGTAESPSFVPLTVGTITLDSVNYTITAILSAQLYPSIKNLSIKVLADGKQIAFNVNGRAVNVDIVEEYEIKSIDSIINNTIARAGSSSEPDFNGDGFIKIQNIYRFSNNLSCKLFITTRQLTQSVFSDIMATQAIIIGGNDGQTQYYLPNSNALNVSVDLRKPTGITWSASIPQSFVINNDQPEPDNPPNRLVQYRSNAGFMIGYIPAFGVSISLNDFTSRTFEIRNNTGKIYPNAVESSKVGSPQPDNSIYSIGMYRIWTDLTKTRSGNRLSVFELPLSDGTIVFIDYSGSMFDDVVLDNPSFNGRNITIIDSKNTILKSDIYNNGFYVDASYIEGETCFLIVKIS